MDNSPEKYVSRLAECSDKKLKLLQDMLELTKAQAEVIDEDGLDMLQKLVSEKQIRIEEINRIDEEFEVYFQRLKQVLKVKNLDELKSSEIKGVKELQEAIGQVVKLISEISTLEKQNSEKANGLLSDIGNEIKKLSQGRRINSAYTSGPMQSPSYFIDKKK